MGIYVDDVYYSRVASATFDFLDVQQLEVLRGPQGTLYGKNTTAGAINITSNQPSFRVPKAGCEVTLGQSQLQAGEGRRISGPLSDNDRGASSQLSTTSRRGTDLYNVTSDRLYQRAGQLSAFEGNCCSKPSDRFRASPCPATTASKTRNAAARCSSGPDETQRPLNFSSVRGAWRRCRTMQVVSRNPFDRLTDIDADAQCRQHDRRAFGLRVKLGPGSTAPSTSDHRMAVLGLEAQERPRFHRPADHRHPHRTTRRSRTSTRQEFRYGYSKATRSISVARPVRLQAKGSARRAPRALAQQANRWRAQSRKQRGARRRRLLDPDHAGVRSHGARRGCRVQQHPVPRQSTSAALYGQLSVETGSRCIDPAAGPSRELRQEGPASTSAWCSTLAGNPVAFPHLPGSLRADNRSASGHPAATCLISRSRLRAER